MTEGRKEQNGKISRELQKAGGQLSSHWPLSAEQKERHRVRLLHKNQHRPSCGHNEVSFLMQGLKTCRWPTFLSFFENFQTTFRRVQTSFLTTHTTSHTHHLKCYGCVAHCASASSTLFFFLLWGGGPALIIPAEQQHRDSCL